MKKTVKIEGMSCGHCVKAVEKALGDIKGVSGIFVSLEESQAVVEAADSVGEEVLRSAVEDAGYEVTSII